MEGVSNMPKKETYLNHIILVIAAAVALLIGSVTAVYAVDETDPSDVDAGTYYGVPWRITADYELLIGEKGQEYSFAGIGRISSSVNFPWKEYCSEINTVTVLGDVHVSEDEYGNSLNGMFYNFVRCTSMDLRGLDTSGACYMNDMFHRCSSLTSLDLRSFNTSNVESMKAMFKGCTSLKELDMSSFDMLNIVDEGESSYYLGLGDIFADCDSLEILRTPKSNKNSPNLPLTMYDKEGNTYNALPAVSKSIVLASSRQLAVETSKEIKFTDVFDKTSWYYDSVYWAVENNVTSGMGEGTFQPMAKLSRAQAVTFLYNLAGRPDVSKLQAKEFTDVSKTAWYYNAVKWAVANKITSGYGTGTFQPNATCNRAMIVTFLANYAKAAGTYKEPTTSASFKDVKAKDWFKKSVDWAVENGITSGYGQGTFSPNVTCNRAMMVTFLKKVAELPMV